MAPLHSGHTGFGFCNVDAIQAMSNYIRLREIVDMQENTIEWADHFLHVYKFRDEDISLFLAGRYTLHTCKVSSETQTQVLLRHICLD